MQTNNPNNNGANDPLMAAPGSHPSIQDTPASPISNQSSQPQNLNTDEPTPFVPSTQPSYNPAPLMDNPDTILSPQPNPSQPAGDSATNQVISPATTHVPKKYGGAKVIATIFGVFLIAGAIVAGVTLVQNQQFRVGFAWDCSTYNFELSQSGDVRVLNGSTRNEPGQQAKVYINNSLVNTFPVPALTPGSSADLGQVNVPSSSGFTWRVVGTVDCQDSGTYGPQNTPTPIHESTPTPTLPPEVSATLTPTHEPTATLTPTLPPKVSAQCFEVIAYDTEWNQLDIQTLSQLSVGQTIYLSVTGTATSGSFDRARFTVNGVLRPETTSVKPGTTNVFYDEFVIPVGITTFTVGAQIHHSELDWI